MKAAGSWKRGQLSSSLLHGEKGKHSHQDSPTCSSLLLAQCSLSNTVLPAQSQPSHPALGLVPG